MRSRLLTLVLVTVCVGCTRGITAPDEVPTATLRPLALSVTPVGGGRIVVGDSVPVTSEGPTRSNGFVGAFAEFAGNQGRYVPAVWTSSDDSIITVADDKLVARGSGSATLTATFEGLSAAETFVVDGGFFGRWSGSFVVEQCGANSSSMQHVLCRPDGAGGPGLAPVGATLAIALEIFESAGEDITGRVSLGQFSGALTGKNRGAGYFSMTGQVAGPGGAITFIEWNMRAARDVMEGVFGYHLTLDGVSGTGGVGARLSNMTRQ